MMRLSALILLICVAPILEAREKKDAKHGQRPMQSPTVSGRMHLVQDFFLRSDEANTIFEIHVALPINYDPSKRYPVLYILDSDFLFGTGSEGAWMLNMEGTIEPLIVVGIGFGTDWVKVSELRFTYFSPNKSPEYPDLTGKAYMLLDFMKNTLFKQISEMYLVNDRRSIWGASMGALFVAYVIHTSPETFQRYIMSSPSFWWPTTPDKGYIFDLEKKYAETHSDLPVKIFAAVGDLESKSVMKDPFQRWLKLLRSRNYNSLELSDYTFPHGTHVSTIPQAYMHGLQQLFATKPEQVPHIPHAP